MEALNIKPTRNNIIVKNPIEPMSTTIVVTEEAKKQHMQQQMEQWDGTCQVVAVGPASIEVKVADKVIIKDARLMSGQPIKNGDYLLFTEGDVVAIY